MSLLLASGSGQLDDGRNQVITGKERHVQAQEAPGPGHQRLVEDSGRPTESEQGW